MTSAYTGPMKTITECAGTQWPKCEVCGKENASGITHAPCIPSPDFSTQQNKQKADAWDVAMQSAIKATDGIGGLGWSVPAILKELKNPYKAPEVKS